MTETDQLLAQFKGQSIFLVWGTTDQGPRSRVMAEKMGIPMCFIYTQLPRGAWYALIRYPLQAIQTMALLFRLSPALVFIQNPPEFAVLCVYLYCQVKKARFVIDAHSTALLSSRWNFFPDWLKAIMTRRAIATLVTNEHLEELVKARGGKAIIIRDIPTQFETSRHYPVSNHFNIAFVNTFSPDEPLIQVLEAASTLPQIQFYITGRTQYTNQDLISSAPANVSFTGYLSDEDYYALLSSVDAVMCLTLQDHTMQRGACEAASLAKPIITSNWGILRLYFNKGTLHVDNTPSGIRQGVLQMIENHEQLSAGMRELQADHQTEWEQKIALLTSLV